MRLGFRKKKKWAHENKIKPQQGKRMEKKKSRHSRVSVYKKLEHRRVNLVCAKKKIFSGRIDYSRVSENKIKRTAG